MAVWTGNVLNHHLFPELRRAPSRETSSTQKFRLMFPSLTNPDPDSSKIPRARAYLCIWRRRGRRRKIRRLRRRWKIEQEGKRKEDEKKEEAEEGEIEAEGDSGGHGEE